MTEVVAIAAGAGVDIPVPEAVGTELLVSEPSRLGMRIIIAGVNVDGDVPFTAMDGLLIVPLLLVVLVVAGGTSSNSSSSSSSSSSSAAEKSSSSLILALA